MAAYAYALEQPSHGCTAGVCLGTLKTTARNLLDAHFQERSRSFTGFNEDLLKLDPQVRKNGTTKIDYFSAQGKHLAPQFLLVSPCHDKR